MTNYLETIKILSPLGVTFLTFALIAGIIANQIATKGEEKNDK